MELTCIIIDDEPHARELLAAYIDKTPGLISQGSFAGALEALPILNSPEPPALIFLDVDMPDLNGLDFAGMVSHSSMVIFTTSYREYAPEAFEKNAVDYLLKPIGYPRFLSAVQKAMARHEAERPAAPDGSFFVKTETKGKIIRVTVEDILYVESMSNYVSIHLAKEKVTAYLTLTEVAAHLPAGRFTRIHKSFLVSNASISTVEQGQVKLAGGQSIPVGRTYHAGLMAAIRPLLLISKRNS